MTLTKTLLCLAVLAAPTVAYAGHVRVSCKRFVAQKAVVVQQAYPVYPYQYNVGAQLQEEAIAERISQRVLAKLESRLQAQGQQAALSQSFVNQRCVKCHSGNNRKTDLDLTDLTLLSCEVRLHAVHRVVSGSMPPKSEPALTPDEAGGVLSELSQPVTQTHGESP